ncbi:MAG: tetratricopeptide repeat protein [Acidobacteria bacterium]|nr:tetratricopeptide repeat protein [Acidobacteriota bacterium]
MKTDSIFEQAKRALSQADFETAIELLGEVVVEDSANVEAWTQLGACYLETRQLPLALETLGRAVNAGPEHAMAHYLLGTAWGSCGNLERAGECYRRALEIDPQHAKAEEFLVRTESLVASREHFRKGLALLQSPQATAADLNQALSEFVQSVALFDQSPARESLADCAQQIAAISTEWPIAFEVTRDLELWAAACERGWQCVRFRNWTGVRAAYEEALAYRWQDAFVHHALGFSLAEAGESDEAVKAWLRVLELDPGYDFTRFGHLQPGKVN